MAQSPRSLDDDTEVASTVTNLISKLPGSTLSKALEDDGILLTKSCVGTYGDETFYSSSKLLKKYLRDHDKNQTWDLAKVLTGEMKFRTKHFSELETSLSFNKENEISKEIKLAKKLLGNRQSVKDDDVKSLTTDDLLTSNPFGILSETNSLNHTKPTRESPCMIPISTRLKSNVEKAILHSNKGSKSTESMNSLHYSHFGFGKNMNARLSQTESETSMSDTNDSSTLNLFSLNGTSYTPHKVKYKTLAKDLRSSLEQRTLSNQTNYNCPCPQDRGDHKCTSPTPTSLLLPQPKTPIRNQNYTAFAGQTPFRSRNCESIGVSDSASNYESIITGVNLIESDSVGDSQSHISVPFHFDDKKSDVQEFIKQCLDEDYGDEMPTTPGSVETLKNMIFTLQSMSTHRNQNESLNDSDMLEENNGNSQVVDGHSSLRRAMSHLSNLKNLTALEKNDT